MTSDPNARGSGFRGMMLELLKPLNNLTAIATAGQAGAGALEKAKLQTLRVIAQVVAIGYGQGFPKDFLLSAIGSHESYAALEKVKGSQVRQQRSKALGALFGVSVQKRKDKPDLPAASHPFAAILAENWLKGCVTGEAVGPEGETVKLSPTDAYQVLRPREGNGRGERLLNLLVKLSEEGDPANGEAKWTRDDGQAAVDAVWPPKETETDN